MSIAPMTWDQKSYWLNGEPAYMISGEIHYYRVPKKDWRHRLELFKQVGGNVVSTYIPWCIHEPREGEFAFADNPILMLDEYLRLCGELGLRVIVRPGPYIYSEFIYGGLPEWLMENYPEVMAKRWDGTNVDFTSISYCHPVFLEKARNWYREVCKILSKHTLSKGGPINFAQVDNEMIGCHYWCGSWDYNPDTMGFGREDGRYPAFLRSRYGEIGILNALYETEYKSFSEVKPVQDVAQTTRAGMVRAKDYQDNYFACVADYAVELAAWLKEFGVDCPVIHNSGNPNMNAFYDPMVEKMGDNFILGSDHYYSIGLDWDDNPTPQHMTKIFCSMEMLRHKHVPQTILEFPSGCAMDWPPMVSDTLKCYYLLNLAIGMKGFSYYVFTGGPNPPKGSTVTDLFDYKASVGSNNEIRPQFYMQRDLGQWLREHSWMAQSERACDVYVGLNREHGRSDRYSSGKNDVGFANFDAWMMNRRSLLPAAMCASYSPNMVDLEDEALSTRYLDRPLWVACGASVSRKIQENLVAYVKNGGKLVCLPVLPHLDEQYRPCTLLADFLEAPMTKKPTKPFVRVDMGDIKNIWANESLHVMPCAPAGARVLSQDEVTGEVVAWKKDVGNNGSAVWLGVQWFEATQQHACMFEYIMGLMGASTPTVLCDNPHVWTSLRTDGQRRMLFVMNLLVSSLSCNVQVKDHLGQYVDVGRFNLKPISVETIEL